MRWLKGIILGVLVALSLDGCSGLADLRPVADTTKKPVEVKTAPKREAPRELGSLWSETSDWNDIYSEAPNRVAGDVILVRLEPRFRVQLLRRLNRQYPVRVKTKVENVDKGKPKVDVKVSTTHDQIAEDDTRQIYVTVTEVLPRHVYRVAASETIRVGGREPLLNLQGEIRNRDIQADESVSSDNIMNLAFDMKPYGGDREIASDTADGGGNG